MQKMLFPQVHYVVSLGKKSLTASNSLNQTSETEKVASHMSRGYSWLQCMGCSGEWVPLLQGVDSSA